MNNYKYVIEERGREREKDRERTVKEIGRLERENRYKEYIRDISCKKIKKIYKTVVPSER